MMNHIKSFLGRKANIKLKDGSTIINVRILEVKGNHRIVKYSYGNHRETIEMSQIAELIGVMDI